MYKYKIKSLINLLEKSIRENFSNAVRIYNRFEKNDNIYRYVIDTYGDIGNIKYIIQHIDKKYGNDFIWCNGGITRCMHLELCYPICTSEIRLNFIKRGKLND